MAPQIVCVIKVFTKYKLITDPWKSRVFYILAGVILFNISKQGYGLRKTVINILNAYNSDSLAELKCQTHSCGPKALKD